MRLFVSIAALCYYAPVSFWHNIPQPIIGLLRPVLC